uniref:Uncharacterized protein n=1 Tax=Aureimonas frigidaquae TaxID=424757 RepID=A0A0N7KXM8_9HYPH|nr:hypothetical protein [Aureimonas frigidaquae]
MAAGFIISPDAVFDFSAYQDALPQLVFPFAACAPVAAMHAVITARAAAPNVSIFNGPLSCAVSYGQAPSVDAHPYRMRIPSWPPPFDDA